MEPQKLIKKIDDRDAVSILIGRYGNKIYARLYDRLHDKQLADEAFRKTVFSFLETVKRLESDDLTEALFSCIAENVCRDMQESAEPAQERCDLVQERVRPQETPAPVISEAASESVEAVEAVEAVEDTEDAGSAEDAPSVGHRWEIAVLLFLIVLVIILLWGVAGLGMQSGMIPRIDLGYTWFDRNVFPLFFDYSLFYFKHSAPSEGALCLCVYLQVEIISSVSLRVASSASGSLFSERALSSAAVKIIGMPAASITQVELSSVISLTRFSLSGRTTPRIISSAPTTSIPMTAVVTVRRLSIRRIGTEGNRAFTPAQSASSMTAAMHTQRSAAETAGERTPPQSVEPMPIRPQPMTQSGRNTTARTARGSARSLALSLDEMLFFFSSGRVSSSPLSRSSSGRSETEEIYESTGSSSKSAGD